MPSRRKSPLTHMAPDGGARMVDVGAKAVTVREAVARGHLAVSPAARRAVREGTTPKGSPIEVARLAGIMAAKRTADLIPLCHQLPLSSVDVRIAPRRGGFEIESRVRTASQTGVEMEALTAVAVAGLALYDMLKAVDKTMVLGEVRLMEKRGGRGGEYRRREGKPGPKAAPRR
ncbi:MAG: cyclic pyranopterin monophosphate synthase MoaC [Vicinamibacteraceae bacterium]|nr:cyclic pyranopterin monophosphate synthase MoaC [Vicinamibacteraceae bacterium]